jgi:hypothetical protein
VGGVALYAILITGVANALRQVDLSCLTRAGIILAVIGACLICCLYVYKQFQLRRVAADYVAACARLRSGIVSDPATPIVVADWAPRTDVAGAGMQSTAVLPQALLKSARELASVGQSSRKWLERCAYALLLGLSRCPDHCNFGTELTGMAQGVRPRA